MEPKLATPIFSSFYQDRARSGNTDMCINLYPEMVIGQRGPKVGSLYNRAGLVQELVIDNGPIRGMFPCNNGFLYVASGNGIYSVSNTYQVAFLGNIGSGSTGIVQMVESPTQIGIVDGTGAWCYDFTAGTFTQVIPESEVGATNPSVIVYQDGFALINSGGTNQIYQSNYNDLSTYATLVGGGGQTANNAFVQNNPQNVVSMYDLQEQVWIFKQKQIEVWQNNGTSGFAFGQIQGISIPTGCVAQYSVCRLGISLIFLGSDDQGQSVVFISDGYGVRPASTFALSQIFQGYSVVSDAIGYAFQRDGHFFYVLTFPTQNTTWVYDLTTKEWHQRSYFSNGIFSRDLSNCYALFNGKNLVGDYRNGTIYFMSDNVYTDNGNPIKWLRQWTAVDFGESAPIPFSFNALELLMETGITDNETENPQIMLRWSDDGGYTWTDYFQMAAGQIGQTSWRVLQNRLGSTKIGTGLNRVFEISGTDPLSIKLYDALIEGGPS